MSLPLRNDKESFMPHSQAAALELLASRICHDLISPVGAINNGVEFLQESGGADDGDAIDLIAYSASQAAAKLQVFRLAYGAGGRDPSIKLETVHTIFGDFLGQDGRIKQEWDPFKPLGYEEIPLGLCKILMGALMLACETLPRGGTIKVEAGETDQTLVIAEGQDAAPRPNMTEALGRTLPVSELDPRLIHAYVLSMIAEQYGFTVAMETYQEGSVRVRIGAAPTSGSL